MGWLLLPFLESPQHLRLVRSTKVSIQFLEQKQYSVSATNINDMNTSISSGVKLVPPILCASALKKAPGQQCSKSQYIVSRPGVAEAVLQSST